MMAEATESARAGLTKALAELRAGRLDGAETLCRRLLTAAPRDPALHLLAATIAFRCARYADADRWARSCLALHPETAPAMVIAGRAARAAGDLRQAMDWFRHAARLSPDRPEPAFMMCVTQLERGDPEAQAILQDVLRRFPDNAEGWCDIGAALHKANQLEAAAVAYARGTSASMDAAHNVNHGSVLLALGRLREAIAAFGNALAAAPDHAGALLPLAQCLRQTGEPQAARVQLERLAAVQPDNSQAAYALGLVCEDLHDLASAIAAYRKCLELQPDLPEAHVNLGLVLQQTGDLEAAKECYRRAMRLRPDTFGRIAQALPSTSKGQLWLDLRGLRRSLGG